MPRTTTSVSGSTNLQIMQNKPDIFILNRPRPQKRGLTINKNGRITLRSIPIKLLNLKRGDKILFFCHNSQMYIVKATEHFLAIPLYGRKAQLHGCSVSTVRVLFNHIPGIPHGAQELDLVVSDHLDNIMVCNETIQALAVVNRADLSHCR